MVVEAHTVLRVIVLFVEEVHPEEVLNARKQELRYRRLKNLAVVVVAPAALWKERDLGGTNDRPIGEVGHRGKHVGGVEVVDTGLFSTSATGEVAGVNVVPEQRGAWCDRILKVVAVCLSTCKIWLISAAEEIGEAEIRTFKQAGTKADIRCS